MPFYLIIVCYTFNHSLGSPDLFRCGLFLLFISRTLQLILAKVCLLLGVRIEKNIQFLDLIEPDGEGKGWTAKTNPEVSAISNYEFDFLVIGTGRQVI